MLTLAVLAGATPSLAQGITQQQGDDLIKERRLIRQALERLSQLPAAPQQAAPQPPPPSDKVTIPSVTGGPMLGRPDAPVTIVEYTDLQCPLCRNFTVNTFDQIKTAYVDTGMVRWVSRDFPLTSLHPHAMRAALASRCAGDQNKYWELRHTLLRNAQQLSPDYITAAAQLLGLDVKAFTACVDANRDVARINKDMQDGQSAGISGTPSFVVGRSVGDGVDGVRLVGAVPFSGFEARIREFLAGSK